MPACCRTEDERDRDRDRNIANKEISLKPTSDVIDFYKSSPAHSPHARIHSQLYSPPLYSFTPFTAIHSPNRYPSPSQSGDLLSLTESRSFCFEPSYSPQYVHNHSPSDVSHYHKTGRLVTTAHSHPGEGSGNSGSTTPSYDIPYHSYDSSAGTFPRKKENQRFRIPSNPSGAFKTSGAKISNGSIEKTSERGSPMPTFHVEVLSPGHRQNKRNSLPDYYCSPHPGELRRVHIDKSAEPLGIQIQCLDSGGVFVSTVSEHSLASKVGLQVGDQLLEVCGINMRSATYQLAASVLRQCGNSITMLVQYSPDKYHELEGSGSSSSQEDERSVSGRGSGSPTPCNSPGQNRKSLTVHNTSTLTRNHPCKDDRNGEPRYLMIETRKCSNLGISLVGGNAVGIYVHSVQNGSLAYSAGLRTGDRILEYNGTDLKNATAEEAAYELAKPADKVTVLAQYNIERYNEIKDKPGDSFYMRALFDRTGDLGDALQLRFHKDDILYVDNTMFNGVPGHWRAWLVDSDGFRQQCGIIPSKYKVEEELLLRRSLGDLESDARRATRRSFFRRKKHQRSDSKELASFSNINLGWYSDSGTLNEDSVTLSSYQRVIRLNSEPILRPVIIVGALSDTVIDKLLQDFPDKFVRCAPEIMHCSQSVMEKGITENLFVDYRKKGSYFECTSVSAVKEACDKSNAHVIIDVSLAGVERLHRQQVYPIVLLIKFKSTKQIKEIRDGRYTLDKVTAKAAKEMYEHGLKIECEHRHYISAVIPAGVNIAYMCTQIQTAVELEQSKTLWVPSLT